MVPVAGGMRPSSFPQMVDRDGKASDRATFEQLRSLGSGSALGGFAAYTQSLAPSSSGKSIKQMLLGGGGDKEARLGAYLINLRQLLTSEAPSTLLEANIPKDVKGAPALRALLDADPNDPSALRDALAANKDSKDPVGDLTVAAGNTLFNLQRSGQSTGEKYRYGREAGKALSADELPTGVYGAINLQLDDTAQFDPTHLVATQLASPEVHPSVRKMIHSDYQNRVSQELALRGPTSLTIARLDELARASVRPFLQPMGG